MKDGVKSLAIVPFDNVLEFIGPVRSADNSPDMSDSLTIKGEARFCLVRPVKIRGMSVKFKGFSRVVQNNHESTSPLLPKLKRPLFGRTTLPAGEHVIPWDIEVPNIYQRSFDIKHACIFYKIELSIAIGLQKKTITAEHPIEIHRHLLSSMDMLSMVETQLFDKTIPTKFHYEINAPQIVCVEQGNIPISVRFLCFGSKPVRSIRTQLTQIEIYRFQSVSRSSTDSLPVNNDGYKKLALNIAGTFMVNRQQRKFVKRVVPALKHCISSKQQKSTWQQRLILRHELQPVVCPAVDSPFITIYHQLEVTFQFDHQFENIKAKIPIVITTVPFDSNHSSHLASTAFKNIPTQDSSRPDSIMSIIGQEVSHVEETDPMEDGESMLDGVQYRVLGNTEPRRGGLPVTSSSMNLLKIDPNQYRFSQENYAASIRKCSSVNDLGAMSVNASNVAEGELVEEEDDEEVANRARIRAMMTTDSSKPLQQRRGGGEKPALPPIDVDLANGIQKRPNLQGSRNENSGGFALVDMNLMRSKARLQQVQDQSRKQRPPITTGTPPPQIPDSGHANSQLTLAKLAMSPRKQTPDPVTNNDYLSNSVVMSPVSSVDGSDNGLLQTLQTRPPSPVFSSAPGLPSAITLNPKEATNMALVEEMFINDQDSAKSPALETLASSTLLSPRTSYMLRRSGTTQTSLSNQARLLGRESSTLDPDGEILRRIWCSEGRGQDAMPPPLPPLPVLPRQETPPLPRQEASVAKDDPPAEDQVPVYRTKLPPLPHLPPTSELPEPPTVIPRPRKNITDEPLMLTRRMTKLYVEDSDDEVLDPLPPIADDFLNLRPERTAPPQLPRLSLGTSFVASLNLDYT